MLAHCEWPQDAFDHFWDAYPRKVSKKLARTCFDRIRKANEVPFEILMSAVGVYARSVVGREMQYVKHPSTWLNQGCWDDDPDALLRVAVQPKVMPLANGMVLIKRGSAQAQAWERYRGRTIPWGPSGVWAVPSEWPPESKT